MSRTIQIGHQRVGGRDTQLTQRSRERSSTHRSRVVALCTTFLLMTVTAGCTASPAEPSVAEPSVTEPAAAGTPSAPTRTAAIPLLVNQPADTPLAPGRYVASPSDAPSSTAFMPVLDVPQGYTNIGSMVVRADAEENRVVWLWDIKRVYTDPCDSAGAPEPVGPSVADLAAALAAQPLSAGTDPVAVTVGGYDALYVEMTTPADLSMCRDGYFRSWPGREDPGPGKVDLLWIVDVEGQRITFDLSYPPNATPEQVDELRQIVTSATFIPREDG